MNTVVDGALTIDRMMRSKERDREPTVSGFTPDELYERYNVITEGRELFGSNLIPLAYDPVWAMALGLNNSSKFLRKRGLGRLEDFSYTDAQMTEAMMEGLKNVSFIGLKGYMEFDEDQDGVDDILIKQIR
ncbi:PREDICTED: gamma-aminobutyric acid type B receptor subunit 1-like, partial [Priapulus caudatus]|uniref:Gamma-aminobutyric acid type B receptor subunit 1-like n=1 Tax=Priapulus caudatus TaxID=37621 RepID=A0ABM1EY17_PRICU